MRKILLAFFLCGVAALQAAVAVNCRSVVKVVSYSLQGDTLACGQGFFITAQGEALLPYEILRGAARAEVIDWKGVHHPVEMLLGASSNYDMARVSTSARKTVFLPLTQDSLQAGCELGLLPYDVRKKSMSRPAKVLMAESFDAYQYLSVSVANENQYWGCPLVNMRGEVAAVVQRNVDKKAENACAIDVRFAGDLSVTSRSALSRDMRAILLPRDIPSEEDEAYSYLYMLRRMAKDSAQFVHAHALFSQRFPQSVRGASEGAMFYAACGQYAEADNIINRALARKDAEELHATLSDIIYQKALYAPEPAYKDWTLERALEESEKAYALRQDTTYIVQQARCLFGLARYQEAHDRFLMAVPYSHRPAELYMYAADALEHAGGDSLAVIALFDKAIECFPRPYTEEAASYLLARALRLEAAGKYRAAVLDYNEYEKAVGPKNLTARFYDVRQAAEVKAHMFQQAIDDLHTALALSSDSNESCYYGVLLAYVYLGVGMLDEAQAQVQNVLKVLPDNADALRVRSLIEEERQKAQGK